MSQTLERYELGDLGLRDVYDEVVMPGSGRSGRRCHIPADEEGTETVCNDMTHTKRPKRKDMSVFPDGWMEWCGGCVRVAGHAEWPDDGHPSRRGQRPTARE